MRVNGGPGAKPPEEIFGYLSIRNQKFETKKTHFFLKKKSTLKKFPGGGRGSFTGNFFKKIPGGWGGEFYRKFFHHDGVGNFFFQEPLDG